ncbi:MAG: helix-turn-helix domain-containing protein [Defluviitaleaceae bacterium]|nr:helix-turn-helix domain-containing protein [Defluviitaleaceae bacterium]
MTKERLRVIIGENIRNERISRNISIDELAEMIGLTPGFVGLIERGQRGTTSNTLLKLSDVFSISIDSLFYLKEGLSLGEVDKDDVRRKKISSLISDFSDNELDFLISVIKGVRAMNRSGADADTGEEDDE